MKFQSFISDTLQRRPGLRLSYILAFISLLLYILVAFILQRSDSIALMASFAGLFICYLILTRSVVHYKLLLAFGIVFRLIFLFSTPSLSDDFYRFFWDGMLLVHQINPFSYLPSEILENPSINIPELDLQLYNSLNSPNYHSVYPPVCQLIFYISAKLSSGNLTIAVFIMKCFLFAAEIVTVGIMYNLLKIHKINKEKTLLYLLNPLVIIELVGNLHFDALLIFFVVLSIFLFFKKFKFLSAASMALAISAKLTPLMFLPFLVKRLKFKKAIIYFCVVFVVVFVTFIPFWTYDFLNGLGAGISLYFQKFEFNASIFYIIREIGFWVKGWDIIQIASKWLALITLTIILLLAFFEDTSKQNIPGVLLWPLFIYFAFASIVHPWYATSLVAFSIFSSYRFPIVWSATIFLSYLSYQRTGFQEHSWVLWTEYLLVFGVMIYELIKKKDLIKLNNPLPEIFNSSR